MPFAVASGTSRFGRTDVVVNNAGYGLVGAVEEVDEADARAIVDTDLFGALWVCQAVLPTLRAQGSGHIVQISTTGAVGAMPTLGLYNAAKWSLEGFSHSPAYDDLRTRLFGSPVVPWPASGGPLGAPVGTAVDAVRAHVAAADGPLRLMVGDDAPAQVRAAVQARCEDYARDPRFHRPAPGPAGP